MAARDDLREIAAADQVIDLGPEGGDEIVAWGPPEDAVGEPDHNQS